MRAIGLFVVILFVALGGMAVINRIFMPREATMHDISTSTATRMTNSTLTLTSSAFENGSSIPALHTCDGEQVSPPLKIGGIPGIAKSMALIAEDPDVPKELKSDGLYVHWVLFNIPVATVSIPQGGAAGIAGVNGAGKVGYAAPCPPPQYEPSEHRYFFHLYALDTMLDLPAGSSRDQVLKAMEGHVIDATQLMGTYKRR